MSNIIFRMAMPSDVNEAIPLILLSGPTSFAFVFDNGSLQASDFLKFAFPKKGGEFSYENHYVLEKEGRLIASGAIYSHQDSKSFTRRDLLNVIKVYKGASFGIVKRGLRIERVLAMPRKGEYYIGHIAVDASERGKGYGERIMLEIMNSRSLSFGESFVLDVDVDNEKAINLYEKLGFEDSILMKSDLQTKYGWVPSHYRLSRKF